MRESRKIAALAAALCLAPLPFGRAQAHPVPKPVPDLQVTVRTFLSGDVAISASRDNAGSGDRSQEIAPALPDAVHCREGSEAIYAGAPNAILCLKALRRNGLALEGEVDLAPILQNLDPSTAIELWLDSPRLGFDTTSTAMTEMGGGKARHVRSIRFEAGNMPPLIGIRFGYRLHQLAAIYLPFVVLALALTLVTAILSRAGLAALSRFLVLLGTVIWMGAAAQFEADGPLRILLYGTPLADLALLFVRFWPPLLCVALGIALGKRLRPGQARSSKPSEIFGSLAIFPLLFTCAAGFLLFAGRGDWGGAAIWLAATPSVLLLRRLWLRASGRSIVRLVKDGELKERLSALAAHAGCPHATVYIACSKRSAVLNAYAWPRRGILFTAALLQSLSKREVDAIAAHELSHFRRSHSYLGMAMTQFCLAFVFFETPLTDLLLRMPGGVSAAILLLILLFFASLRGMRKREFAADAGSAALTGDPRAMIGALARIARNNKTPLEMHPAAVWLSSHPSTPDRIRALAAAAKLEAAEVDLLSSCDDPGSPYELPQLEASQPIARLGWRQLPELSRSTGRLICKRARDLLFNE